MKKGLIYTVIALITICFYACEKDEALTPNPIYNPEATGEDPGSQTTSIDTTGNGGGSGGGNGGGNNNGTGTLSAELDGFVTIFSPATYEFDGFSEVIVGTSGVTELEIDIFENVSANSTYMINSFNTIDYYTDTSNPINAKSYSSKDGSGQIVIGNFVRGQTIVGTFNTVLVNDANPMDSIVVTNGTFNF